MKNIRKWCDTLKYGEINKNAKVDTSLYKEFDSSKSINEWGHNHYHEWSRNYLDNMKLFNKLSSTPNLNSCIESYCGYGFKEINSYLRFEHDIIDSHKEFINMIIYSICSAPKLIDNIVVYRMVCDDFIKELLYNNRRGSATEEKAFLSTSLSKDIINVNEPYTSFRHLLKLYVPQGISGIYVNSITRRSEEEFLFPPKAHIELINKPYIDNGLKVYECRLFYMH